MQRCKERTGSSKLFSDLHTHTVAYAPTTYSNNKLVQPTILKNDIQIKCSLQKICEISLWNWKKTHIEAWKTSYRLNNH